MILKGDEVEKDFEVWSNFKRLTTHMSILIEDHPGISEMIKGKTDLKGVPFKLNASDTRVYTFFDSKGVDTYQRLVLDGTNQSIMMIEDGHKTVIDRDMLAKRVDLDSLDGKPSGHLWKAIEFTERRVEHFQKTKIVDPSQALENVVEDEYER